MSDLTESTISMIPIKKLKDASGNYYPLAIFESVVTSHDIKLNSNFGTYKSGDVIPERTSLDEILANLVSYDKHILKSNIDATVLSADTDRVPSSYLLGNLLKSGSAYVKKEEANADLKCDPGYYISGIKQIDGKLDSITQTKMGGAALSEIDKKDTQDVDFETLTNDYTDSDSYVPSSSLVKNSLEFLKNRVKELIGSSKYIGKTTGNDNTDPLAATTTTLYMSDGTSISTFLEGYIVNHKDNLYIYYNSKWIRFSELEIYTGNSVPQTYNDAGTEKISDTSKVWFDTSVSHIVSEQSADEQAARSDIIALKSLTSKLQIGFNELYRIVMLGAVPGTVDDSYKSKLVQVDLSDDIDENIPNDIKRSSTLIALKIFGNSYVGNGSKYTAIYNPTGTTKTGVVWSFTGCDEQVMTKSEAISYINTESASGRYCFTFAIGSTRALSTEFDFVTAESALEKINSIEEESELIITLLKKQSIHIIGYVDATKEDAKEYLETVTDTEVNLKINGVLEQFVTTSSEETASKKAIARIEELSDDDVIQYGKYYQAIISDYNKQTCTINIPDVDMIVVCDNNIELVVKSTEVLDDTTKAYINTSQMITVGGEKPIPEEDGEPTIPAICAKKDTASNFSAAAQQGKLIDGELCFYTDQGKFSIYYDGKFYTLKSATTDTDALDIDKLQNTALSYLLFTDPNGVIYKVYTDSNGEWKVTPYDSNYPAANYSKQNDTDNNNDVWINSRVSISSFYCGGPSLTINNGIDKECLASHNFVELQNATDNTVKLDGCILLFTNGSLTTATGYNWTKLNLTGEIKPHSTFLIRGSRCNTDNDSLIVIDKFDMEWRDSDGNLISFNNNSSVTTNGCAFFLCTGSYDSTTSTLNLKELYQKLLDSDTLLNPWLPSGSTATKADGGYIDLCGVLQVAKARNIPFESAAYVSNKDFRKVLFIKWFQLDPSKQALKSYTKRSNKTTLTAIYLDSQTTRLGNHIQYYYPDFIKQRYTPKASSEKKNFFTINTKFDETKPNAINITFGKQATETINNNNNIANHDASRCFNWISVGNYDEYVEYRKIYNDRGIVSTLPTDFTNYSINDTVTLSTTNNKYYYNGNQWKLCITGTVNYYDNLINNGNYYKSGTDIYVFVTKQWVKATKKDNVSSLDNLSTDIKNNTIGTFVYVENKLSYYAWIGYEWISCYELSENPLVTISIGDVYYCKKTNQYYEWDGYNWIEIINGWIRRYSITKDNANDPQQIKEFYDYYDRYRWATPYGSWVTTHKCIAYSLSKGNYQYRVGRDNDVNYISDIRTFEVKNDNDVTTFSVIQTTDQQGFNWMEYQAWKKASYQINKTNKDTFDFSINTGDIAQSGNRPNEWLDYFDGKQYINDKVEMFTVGNNDLCGRVSSELTDGLDATSKYNHINAQRYFAFELDINNYTFDSANNVRISNYYTQWKDLNNTEYNSPLYSLYSYNYGKYHFISLNSENCDFSIKTYTDKYDDLDPTQYDFTVFADAANRQIESWLEKDLILWKNISDSDNIHDCSKCIVYMHHMPFTLATDDYFTSDGSDRSVNGSALNIYDTYGNYRFTRLFKRYGIRLILGGHKHTFTIPTCVYDAPSYIYPSLCYQLKNLPSGIDSDVNVNNLCDIINVSNESFDYLWNGVSWESYVNIDESVNSSLPETVVENEVIRLRSEACDYIGLNINTVVSPTYSWQKIISMPITGKVSTFGELSQLEDISEGDIYLVKNSHKKYKYDGSNWNLMYNVHYRPHSFYNNIDDRHKLYGEVYCVTKKWTEYERVNGNWIEGDTYQAYDGVSTPIENDVRWYNENNIKTYQCYQSGEWQTFTLETSNHIDAVCNVSDLSTTATNGSKCCVCTLVDSGNEICNDFVYGYQIDNDGNNSDSWLEIPTYIRKSSVNSLDNLPTASNNIYDIRLVTDRNIEYCCVSTSGTISQQWKEIICFSYKGKVSDYSDLPTTNVIHGSVYYVENSSNYYYRNNHTVSWFNYNTDISDMLISLNIKDSDATDKGGRIKSKTIDGVNQGKYPVREVIFEKCIDDVEKLPILKIGKFEISESALIKQISKFKLKSRNWQLVSYKGKVTDYKILVTQKSKVVDDVYYVENDSDIQNSGYYFYNGSLWTSASYKSELNTYNDLISITNKEINDCYYVKSCSIRTLNTYSELSKISGKSVNDMYFVSGSTEEHPSGYYVWDGSSWNITEIIDRYYLWNGSSWIILNYKGEVDNYDILIRDVSQVTNNLYYTINASVSHSKGYYQYDSSNWVIRISKSNRGDDAIEFDDLTDISINTLYITFGDGTTVNNCKQLKYSTWESADDYTGTVSRTITNGDLSQLSSSILSTNIGDLYYATEYSIYTYTSVLTSDSKWLKITLKDCILSEDSLPSTANQGDTYYVITTKTIHAYINNSWYQISINSSYSSLYPECLPNNVRNYYLDKTIIVNTNNKYKYYLVNINGNESEGKDGNRGEYKWQEVKSFIRLKCTNKINAPTYIMSQASGYKLISNKELPASPLITVGSGTSAIVYTFIPWIMNYFANGTAKKASENLYQHSPMYIKYTFNSSSNNAIIDVRQVTNIYAYGSSSIDFNSQLQYINDILYFEHTLNNI